MNNFNLIIDRAEELNKRGEELLGTAHRDGRRDYVDQGLFYQWQATCQAFLNRVFGTESDYYIRYKEVCDFYFLREAERGHAIMKAASDELEHGFLKNIETLVSADIFSNFLEMAEHLLEEGYKDPAASLIGAVLEDGLFKIGKHYGIAVKEKDTLNTLNNKLSDAEVYNRLTQKRVKVWIDTRNYADHGNFDKYSSENVNEMFKGVRDLLESHL